MEEIERIRQAYYREGKSIREIAREQHHSRRVVRAALKDAGPWKYQLTESRSLPVMGPVKGIIDQWLQEDQQRPKKQRHTAHKIWKRLVEEHQFKGAESTVRLYVREHRPVSPEGRACEAMIPLAYRPGEDAQADFGQAEVIMAGKRCVRYSCVGCVTRSPEMGDELKDGRQGEEP